MKKNSLFIGMVFVAMAAVAATAFVSQRQQLVNRDPAASAADVISTMSCILTNMAADLEATADNPNPSGYLALIDVNLCQGGAPSGEGTVPNYTRYWVEPKIVNEQLSIEAWDLSQDRTGFIKATVNAGKLVRPPFGEWEVDWCIERKQSEGNYASDTCAKKGHVVIDAKQNYELFYRRELSSGWTAYEKASRGAISTDQMTGLGKYTERNNDNDLTLNAGYFAFGPGALKDSANGTAVCKNPSASDSGLRRTLWEAWLYNPDDQTVMAENSSETSGFPVQKVGTNSTGWAGYEGIRMNGSKAAEQSGEFKRLNGDRATYTAYGSYGKLIKHTNTRLTGGLAALDRVVLQVNLYRNAFTTSLFKDANYTPTVTPWNDRAKALYFWDNTKQKFVFFARDASASGGDGKVFTTFTTPHEFTINELLAAMRTSASDRTGSNLRSYERSIWGFQKGSDRDHHILLADSEWPNYTARSAANVIVTRLDQTQVVPGSVDAPTEDLVCIGKCPRDVGVPGKLQLEQRSNYPINDPRVTDYYDFNANGDLKNKGKIIKYEKTNGVDTYIDRNQIDTQRNDFWLDAFVPKSKLSQLKCERGANYCSYDTISPENVGTQTDETYGVRGLDYYYVWQTGTDRWTKYNGIKKNDVPLIMEAPMALIYDVPNDPSYGMYAGKKTSMKYLGNGQLWTPGRCENIVTGGVASSACDQTNEVYVHDFIVPYSADGSVQGRVKDGSGKEYLVKWSRQGVYYPRHSDQNLCETNQINAGFETAKNLILPTSNDWNNPRSSMLSKISTLDTSAVPRYVHGVKQ